MTKLDLKELRELHARGSALATQWTGERSLIHAEMFAKLPALLDWIERMRSFLPGILCELDNGAPTDRNIALAQLLAELED